MNKDNKNTELNDTDKKLHISDVMVSSTHKYGYQPDEFGNCKCKNCTGQIEYYRFDLGIKKYGYNSEFRKSYQSMLLQLRHDELNEFFDEWDVPKN
jgi:hypothetical protein